MMTDVMGAMVPSNLLFTPEPILGCYRGLVSLQLLDYLKFDIFTSPHGPKWERNVLEPNCQFVILVKFKGVSKILSQTTIRPSAVDV